MRGSELSRRAFIAGTGAAAATVAACSSNGERAEADPEATKKPPPFDPGDWDSVRAQFDLDDKVHHFAGFVLGSHPRPVREAIAEYRKALDRNTEAALTKYAERDAEVAAAAAEYLGVAPAEVALTDSTTMGIGVVYGGLRLAPGDEILTTEHDFYSTHETLRWRAGRGGHKVHRARLYDDPAKASTDQIVSRLMAGLTPATRVVAVTWVHSSTGVRLPIAEISAALKGKDVLLCVDGVHGFGAVDAGPPELGCDFLMTGTHKWLYGPRGTGLVWGKGEAWAQLDPVIPPFSEQGFQAWLGGGEVDRSNPGTLFSPGGYHSFEHRWALGQAFELHQAIGRDKVTARITEQATALKEGLAAIDGVTVITPMSPDLSAGIVCLTVDGQEVTDTLGVLLEADIVASLTPYATPYVRLGPGIVTTPDEVDLAVSTIAASV